jgi:outer membrane protein OmpA-like peptidoglycan-associated protein
MARLSPTARWLVRLLASTCVTLTAAAPAAAQDVRQYQADETVDPRDVAAILGGSPDAALPPGVKMRGVRLLGEAGAKAAPSGLSLPVRFSFDSSQILPAARRQLDALAEGIRLLPAGKTVMIEGHTDARGSAQYNEQLSLRRAGAVKRYLVAAHGLDPQRLQTGGKGEAQPRPGLDPNASAQRRVEFRGQ